MQWKQDFEYWLTNNMYINSQTAHLIIKHVEHYYKPDPSPRLQEAAEWVRVEDGLPEFGEKVLVFGESKGRNPSMGGAYICLSERQDLKGTMLEKEARKYQDENQFKLMTYVTHWQKIYPPKK